MCREVAVFVMSGSRPECQEGQFEIYMWLTRIYCWWLGDCELLYWTFSAGLQRRFMADDLLPCSRVGSQQHGPQTSAASSKHCTPKHYSFHPGQQLCLLPLQHQAWIFQLYRQLCASVRALQPHEPRHWQWPFTSGQSRVSRQTICCIPEPNSQFPEAVI